MPRKAPSRQPLSTPETLAKLNRPVSRPSSFSIAVLAVVLIVAVMLRIKQHFFDDAVVAPTPMSAPGAASLPSTEADTSAIIAKVASHISVKQDETPTIATIEDIEALQVQNLEFYKDAQNGDRLLIWSDQAVLYSPSKDLILAVLPLSLPPGIAAATSTASMPDASVSSTAIATSTLAAEGATIEVRNGSGIPGVARKMADRLKAMGFKVLPARDVTANRNTYKEAEILIQRWETRGDELFPKTEALLSTIALVEEPNLVSPDEENVKGDYVVIIGAKFQP